jgi:glycopeptide antibiotics resistance protein
MYKEFLEPFWTEFSMSAKYWTAIVQNVIGFIPLGFCFYPYFAALSVKRPARITVALGTAVSLTIEVLQGFLPTRDSGTTDLFTNTLGTWIGVAGYNLIIPLVTRLFPGMTWKR